MNNELKFESPKEKYSVDEFLEIFKQRRDKLYNEYKNLTIEEAREEFKKLYDDCPISLHIDSLGLMDVLEKHFPKFWDSTNSRQYTIPINKSHE